jgi:hypothetical protein
VRLIQRHPLHRCPHLRHQSAIGDLGIARAAAHALRALATESCRAKRAPADTHPHHRCVRHTDGASRARTRRVAGRAIEPPPVRRGHSLSQVLGARTGGAQKPPPSWQSDRCELAPRLDETQKERISTPTLHSKRPRGRPPAYFCGQPQTVDHRNAPGALQSPRHFSFAIPKQSRAEQSRAEQNSDRRDRPATQPPAAQRS